MATHKPTFFPRTMRDATSIDSRAARASALTLAPGGDAWQVPVEDCQPMVEDGLLVDGAETFDALLQRCRSIAGKLNAATRGSTSGKDPRREDP